MIDLHLCPSCWTVEVPDVNDEMDVSWRSLFCASCGKQGVLPRDEWAKHCASKIKLRCADPVALQALSVLEDVAAGEYE